MANANPPSLVPGYKGQERQLPLPLRPEAPMPLRALCNPESWCSGTSRPACPAKHFLWCPRSEGEGDPCHWYKLPLLFMSVKNAVINKLVYVFGQVQLHSAPGWSSLAF